MVLVDGGYYQQKRVLLHMPKLSVTRSANAKTIVAPYMKNMFLTLDYTNRADVIQFNEQELEYLYKDNGTIIPEYYWWLENEVISNEDVFDVDIVGVKRWLYGQKTTGFASIKDDRRTAGPRGVGGCLEWPLIGLVAHLDRR
ncbi:hypothetical protein DFQ28_008633 [Apophysomyces sp. BC1034]|nr:hypothetical protein DFQ28_008633 [Apophysomyces sp. BC1034]